MNGRGAWPIAHGKLWLGSCRSLMLGTITAVSVMQLLPAPRGVHTATADTSPEHSGFCRRRAVVPTMTAGTRTGARSPKRPCWPRGVCGSRHGLESQRASLEAMPSHARLKKDEAYVVPLARMAMALEAQYRQHSHAATRPARGLDCPEGGARRDVPDSHQ